MAHKHIPLCDLLHIRLGHFRSLHIFFGVAKHMTNTSDRIIDRDWEYGYIEGFIGHPLNMNE